MSCSQQYVDMCLEDGRLHIQCPGAGCKHLINTQTVERLASSKALATQAKNLRDANERRLKADVDLNGGGDPAFVAFCSAHARKCPRCAVIVFRDGGCNHISCKCGAHFDWEKTPGALKLTRIPKEWENVSVGL